MSEEPGRDRGRDILEAPLRRGRFVLGAVAVGLLGALAVSAATPRRYRASALVWAEWIDPADADRASSAADLAQRRLGTVRQRVLALSATERERIGAPSAVVDVRPVAGGIFSIDCVDGDPSKAALVSNRLASLLVEEAEREQKARAGADPAALEARLAGARQAMEQKAAAFTRRRAAKKDGSRADPRLTRLARDYEQARQAYLDLEEQWRAAETASRIGRGGGVRFTLLRPASAPLAPFSPRRLLFVAVGAVLGLLAGLGGAVLAELRDQSVKGPEDLREVLPYQLLAEVPFVRVRRSDRRVPARRGSRSP